jgi:uncharacterized protein YndB with AHSA1/START domain
MTNVRLVRDYPHAPAKVWRALTEPALMARWGMRPEGFAPTVGTRFRFVGQANPAWRGFVDCEVIEVRSGELLRYSWVGTKGGRPTTVSYTLAPHLGGTRLTVEHRGFAGVGGFLFAKLLMVPGWKKLLGGAFPAVLGDMAIEPQSNRGR